MEAVPRLPMLSFELKISPVCPDFSTPFKRFISKYYGEDGDLYDREIVELENLRNNACRAPRDFTGCSTLKRYYCQIYSLFNRFAAFENNIGVQCLWVDIYSGQTTIGDLDFELACILYNIGALHAELGANDTRQTAEEMKISCTHFQCAVWAFQHLIEDKKLFRSSDLSNDVLQFFIHIMLAQAQECILEKSMLDNRKSSIVAKVTAQVVEYYKSAMSMLQQGAMNTSSQSSIIEVVGSKLFKQWKKFVEFKVAYYDSICSLYMGNTSEELQKMGERVAWYESADSKIQNASQLAKQLDDNSSEISAAISFVSDVILVKLNNAKKENDFIYHEKIPPASQLTEVKGASLVKGIPFNICDPEVSGPDIFARLVSIEAHEIASIYSARKDEILRDIRSKIEEKNQELISYMSSLQLEKETLRAPKDDSIPDELINVCAELSLHPESVQDVEKTLTQLDSVSEETGKIIEESRQLLKDEEEKENEYQEKFCKRVPSLVVAELSKELSKHEETHKKAIESNRSLWENFEQHKDDVLVMTSSSASKIAAILPSNKNIKIDESTVSEMERLFDKIDEMKNQRFMLEEQLFKEMDQDNVLKLVLAHPRDEIEKIFDDEIKKYDKIINLIKQNLSAQQNILRALTNCNAGYADTRKEIIEVQRNRKTRIASLLYTYQVFKELQINSKKGLEFYQKFQSIVTRLKFRIRGVTKVQEDERTQYLEAYANRMRLSSGTNSSIPTANMTPYSFPSGQIPNNTVLSNIPTTGAKLKDYLPFMKSITNQTPIQPAINAAILTSTNHQPSVSIGSSTSFAPSAPSLTPPTVPIVQNQPVPINNSYASPTPVASNLSYVPMQSIMNAQHLQVETNPSRVVSTLNSQYSPPPSYSQALSTQVTYSLPSIISGVPNSTTTISALSFSNIASGNGSIYRHPISSVLPIQPQQKTHNQKVIVPFVSSQSYLTNQFQQPNPTINYASSYMKPSTSTVAVSSSSSYHQQQYYTSTSNSIPSQTNIYHPGQGFASQTQTQQFQPNNNYAAKPIRFPNSQNQSYLVQHFPVPVTYTNIQQPNSSNNYVLNQPRPHAQVQPMAQPYGSYPSHPTSQQMLSNSKGYPPQPNASIMASSASVISTNSVANSTINPYQNQQQMANSFQTPMNMMMNGHYGTTQTNNLSTTNNQSNNITAILEQESKRGWSVLTPTPATVINNNSTKTESSVNNHNHDSELDNSLPDILTTMLSINNNNNNNEQISITTSNPVKSTTNLSVGQQGSIVSSGTTDPNQHQFIDSSPITTSNNEPKDLLSQFDPLFT